MDKNEFKVKGDEVLTKIKEIIHEGNIRRITVKDDQGKVVFQIPLSIGIIGTVLAPFWIAIATAGVLIGNYSIHVQRKEGAPPAEKQGKEVKEEADKSKK